MSTSPGQVVKQRIKTLERRIQYLEDKEFQNSWDKAEVAALDMVLDVIEENPELAVKVVQAERQEAKKLQGVG